MSTLSSPITIALNSFNLSFLLVSPVQTPSYCCVILYNMPRYGCILPYPLYFRSPRMAEEELIDYLYYADHKKCEARLTILSVAGPILTRRRTSPSYPSPSPLNLNGLRSHNIHRCCRSEWWRQMSSRTARRDAEALKDRINRKKDERLSWPLDQGREGSDQLIPIVPIQVNPRRSAIQHTAMFQIFTRSFVQLRLPATTR
ncbi:hypothetical protein BDV96DRAFT_159898 [Lophiotrema nucula]|uniref:Uncharacterized protein n=1 Tax=Lophiotrema nucula TaxID=690887 RepID=A0A6A5YZZ2_9PLEO|nr:hypothetical protein BDV96DRAFT_159898 [Lophiotrema nucula]